MNVKKNPKIIKEVKKSRKTSLPIISYQSSKITSNILVVFIHRIKYPQ